MVSGWCGWQFAGRAQIFEVSCRAGACTRHDLLFFCAKNNFRKSQNNNPKKNRKIPKWTCGNYFSRWWQLQYFFGIFTPNLGEDEPILTHIFQLGWFNHQLLFFFFGGWWRPVLIHPTWRGLEESGEKPPGMVLKPCK